MQYSRYGHIIDLYSDIFTQWMAFAIDALLIQIIYKYVEKYKPQNRSFGNNATYLPSL